MFSHYAGTVFDQSAGIDFAVSNLTYDFNGNIKTMDHKAFTVAGSPWIDQMTYSYPTMSNKLSGVSDAVNTGLSKLGDFSYDPATKTSSDYTYDVTGSLTADKNKGITMTYTQIGNLLYSVTKGQQIIYYKYDADGQKLGYNVVDNSVVPAVTNRKFYIGGYEYWKDTLQQLSQEEGRVRWAYHKYLNGTSAYGYEYDFFEKDHLGNTRVVLTQQKDTAQYLASMETAYRANETALFGPNVASTAVALTSISGYPSTDNTTTPNNYVSKLNGSGSRVGPSLLLKVMAGDKLDIGVKYYFNTLAGNPATTNSFTDVLNSLATAISSATNSTKGTAAQLIANSGTLPMYGALNSWLVTNDGANTGKPKAYLNWILLDEQLRAAGGTGYPVVTAGALTTLAHTGLPVTKNGFVYIWVSNESQGWDVAFDNLSVTHYSGPLLEENHYYPFGLGMTGINSKAFKPNYVQNLYRFGGKEAQTGEFSDGSGLEEYDFGVRMLDPQLGVWHSLDPLADKSRKWSPYNYAYDNPIRFIDPDGMKSTDADPENSTDGGEDPKKHHVKSVVPLQPTNQPDNTRVVNARLNSDPAIKSSGSDPDNRTFSYGDDMSPDNSISERAGRNTHIMITLDLNSDNLLILSFGLDPMSPGSEPDGELVGKARDAAARVSEPDDNNRPEPAKKSTPNARTAEDKSLTPGGLKPPVKINNSNGKRLPDNYQGNISGVHTPYGQPDDTLYYDVPGK